MLIRAPSDLGAIVRERRRELKMAQADLAGRIGSTRQWVGAIEHGHARAELGMVLRLLDALSLPLHAGLPGRQPKADPAIDAILDTARRGRS